MSEGTGTRELTREFLTYIQVEKGLSRNTLQNYARDISRLKTWADTKRKRIEQLDRKDLREWIASMSPKGCAVVDSPCRSAARGSSFLCLSGSAARSQKYSTPQRSSHLRSPTEERWSAAAPGLQTMLACAIRAMLAGLRSGLRVSESALRGEESI